MSKDAIRSISEATEGMNDSEINVLKENMRSFVSELRSHFVFKYDGVTYLVSHAGVSAMPEHLHEVPAHNFIFGVGKYETQIDELWSKHVPSDTLVCAASKSTTQGPFKELFQEIWNTLDADDVQTLKDLSEQNNCSFVFEVCHVDNKHIIDFNENHLYLLDAIPNTYNTAGITVDTQFSQAILQQVKPVSEALSLKEELCTFNNRAELDAYVDAHRNDHTLEGMVLVDDRGYMCKEKFLYYVKVKQLRGYLGSCVKAYLVHNPLPTPKQAWMTDVADKVLRSGYFTDEELENLHVIDAVKFYESYYKTLEF